MSARRYLRPWLPLLLAAAVPPARAMPAQEAPAPTTSGAMPAMAMPEPAHTPATPAHVHVQAAPASPAVMPGMHSAPAPASAPAMPAMEHGAVEHGSMPRMDRDAMPGDRMGYMHGGGAPGDARDPDYSAGTTSSPAHGIDMSMDDSASFGTLLVNQLETFDGKEGNGRQWDIEGHYGNDYDKLWLRTEGERSGGRLADASVEVLWNHAAAPFWGSQLGLRNDAGDGPRRQWIAVGFQGLAPYWFELEATAYAGASGRTAFRVHTDYELLLTQRLILQPQFEANAYGRADPARRLGSGLSDASLALRLRYEFHRQFAPYVGVVWTRRFGATADFARQEGHAPFDRQWVAGVRIGF